ncbi:MAG: nucleoside-triphosphatase [Erysipelotrichaceae bacterium]|nr:nucleoside-triphosphatase [Erysipelotrichaceae bacterium]
MRSIFFISGVFDSGKTTRLIKIFNDLPMGEAEGFACVKIYNDQQDTVGYALRRLSTNLELMFIYDKRFYDDSFEGHFEYERFVFSKNALRYVSDVIDKALKEPIIKTVFLDEIGTLELNDLGFNDILRKMIRSDKNIYLCINDRHIDDISRKYGINQYHCI